MNDLPLRKAQSTGQIDQFIANHKADEPGDEALFNATLGAMAGTLTITREASDEALSDD